LAAAALTENDFKEILVRVIFVETKPTMQAALLHFANETPEGARFVRDFSHDGLRAPDMQALKILDRFLPDGR
jgi:hypothetical protein